MPTDGTVVVNGGKQADTSEIVVNGQTVERQRVVIGDPTQAEKFAKIVDDGSLNTSTSSQNIFVSTANATTDDLAPGATWTGAWESSLNVMAIQVAVTIDQTSTLYVDQSIGGTTADFTDEFSVYGDEGFTTTVQAVASYVRLRLVNGNALATATNVQVAVYLVPIANAPSKSNRQVRKSCNWNC